MKRCTLIADSLVSGEPLSDGDRAHLASCADCALLASMPRLIAATATAPEPGPGFASRVTAHARERLASRRRQRVLGLALATAAAAATAVYVVQRDGEHARQVANAPSGGLHPGNPPVSDDEISNDELGTLVHDTRSHPTDWAAIDAPLRNYRPVLARGGTP